jgi:hypothetical protein
MRTKTDNKNNPENPLFKSCPHVTKTPNLTTPNLAN